jgi:TPR repeat protein
LRSVAANPFDNTRPVGVPGVSFAKIVPKAAISACEEAATAAPDDARMAMQLGRAYLAAKDFDAARVQFVRAYQQGNAQAAANLANLYEKGQGVPRDDAEAVRLSKIAADQGNAQGQNGLGFAPQSIRDQNLKMSFICAPLQLPLNTSRSMLSPK